MNSIELFKENAPELLDTLYKQESSTADFDIDGALVKAGANANEIIVPKLEMDGLGDFDRNSGYLDGDVNLTNETVKFNYERGRKLQTDAIDDEETGGVIMSNLSSEFLKTKVIPEVDAVRYATYASIEDITDTEETLETGEEVYGAIAKAYDDMTDAEVPESDRHLRITATLLGLIRDMDTTKSKELLSKFATIKTVPQNRFYNAIDLLSGSDADGERIGGYRKAAAVYELTKDTLFVADKTYYTKSGDVYTEAEVTAGDAVTANTYYEFVSAAGVDINFMIIHKPALLQYTKHNKMKVFTPEQDQDGDRYKWLYRLYGLNDVYENKVAGIACSHK